MVIDNLLSREYKNLLQQINMLDDISSSTQMMKMSKKNSFGENCCINCIHLEADDYGK